MKSEKVKRHSSRNLKTFSVCPFIGLLFFCFNGLTEEPTN